MKHSFIAPINYLHLIPDWVDFHLMLAHLLERKDYVSFYRGRQEKGDEILLDNSAFEFKRPIELDEMLRFIDKAGIQPNIVVAPDYPFEPWERTVRSFERTKNKAVQSNLPFKLMCVPQSLEGDWQGWLQGYEELLKLEPDFLGISILGVPNAFKHLTGTTDVMMNRIFLTTHLLRHQMVDSRVKYHYLGLGLPRELLIQQQLGVAYSNDSSSAFLHGIKHIDYDDSYGGLVYGKEVTPLNFDEEYNSSFESTIKRNIDVIRKFITI